MTIFTVEDIADELPDEEDALDLIEDSVTNGDGDIDVDMPDSVLGVDVPTVGELIEDFADDTSNFYEKMENETETDFMEEVEDETGIDIMKESDKVGVADEVGRMPASFEALASSRP